MKNSWLLISFLAICLPLSTVKAACLDGQRNSESFLDLLATVVSSVNTIVNDPELELYLIDPKNPSPPVDNQIAVSSVTSTRANGVIAQVQPACREILVSGIDFSEGYSNMAPSDSLLVGYEAQMLTLLLLHEIGHIDAKHSGAFFPLGGAALINLDDTASKKRELEADDFASSILADHVSRIDKGTAETSAIETVMFISMLTFELGGRESIENFGCRVLGCREVFWDHGRSHENFHYRLLQMSHNISPTETSMFLLDDFEKHRSTERTGGFWIIQDGERIYVDDSSKEFEAIENLLRTLPPAR